LGVSIQVLRNKISHWLGNQHRRRWQELGNTQQQARKLISGPCRSTKVRLLSFNRIQSRVVTGHNILRSHLHLMGLTDSPLCRKCGAEDEISAHILCQCEALASPRPLNHKNFGEGLRELRYLYRLKGGNGIG
jgi:hypothetical protein